MKRIVHITAKVLLTLLCVSPVLGALGIFPEPTRDLYNTDQAFTFISVLMESGYLMLLLALVFAVSAILLWTRREAVAALLLLPVTVNIVCFHAFLDGGLFTAGAIMGNLLLILNVYFLWYERENYRTLLMPR